MHIQSEENQIASWLKYAEKTGLGSSKESKGFGGYLYSKETIAATCRGKVQSLQKKRLRWASGSTKEGGEKATAVRVGIGGWNMDNLAKGKRSKKVSLRKKGNLLESATKRS